MFDMHAPTRGPEDSRRDPPLEAELAGAGLRHRVGRTVGGRFHGLWLEYPAVVLSWRKATAAGRAGPRVSPPAEASPAGATATPRTGGRSRSRGTGIRLAAGASAADGVNSIKRQSPGREHGQDDQRRCEQPGAPGFLGRPCPGGDGTAGWQLLGRALRLCGRGAPEELVLLIDPVDLPLRTSRDPHRGVSPSPARTTGTRLWSLCGCRPPTRGSGPPAGRA